MSADKFKLLFSMTIFGTIGLVRRYIPYPSSVIAMVRGYVGAAYLLIMHFTKRKPFLMDAIRKSLPILLISGIFIGFNWICLFEAYRYTSVSAATMCYYMAPVFVILSSPFIFHEPLTKKKGLCSATALAGMILVSGILNSDPSGLTGVIFGLAAAVMYAIVVILNKFVDNGLPAEDRTLIQLIAAAVAVTPYVLFTEDLFSLEINLFILVMLAIAGIIHTGFAYALYFGSIQKIPAQSIALFSYIDPVVAVLLSVLVLKEPLSISSVIGIILVLGSMIISEL